MCLPDGTCGARPECARDTDCAVGFTCEAGRCACEDDSACAANQQCTEGRCQSRARCASDQDCRAAGGRCEVTSGQCFPVCTWPTDCAPTLDARVALALYSCDRGTCRRRCTQDLQCGLDGVLCDASGICAAAECDDLSDCQPGDYCTSANFGRCRTWTPCTSAAQCLDNFECRAFTALECPPGFDCAAKLCLELPQCLADSDCVTFGFTDGGASPTGYCEQGHCQPSPTCTADAQCAEGKRCIGRVCVPAVCRGNDACDAGAYCVDGACVPEVVPAQINVLRLTPTAAWLVEGDTVQLALHASRLDATGTPVAQAQYEQALPDGGAGALVSVTTDGLVTAISEGEVRVSARVAGSIVRSNAVTLRVLPAVLMGRRVVVTDAATGQPLAGVQVRACQGSCAVPTDVTTTELGLAEFPLLDGQPATFTAAPTALRDDGLPTHERASVLDAAAQDVALPLRENPVKSAAGFSGTLSFTYVSTAGSFWAGLIATSVSDVPSLTPQRLLGDTFMTEIPGVGQRVPVPGAVVLYTSPGLGIPQEVKAKALAFSQPGTGRFAQAWAGRAYPAALTNVRSVEVLSYLGAFDYAQRARLDFVSYPYVPDTTDVDGDGLCSVAASCPMGSEEVPDYARFTNLTFQPNRQQRLRTEVSVPPIPANFDNVLVASTLGDAQAGLLPTGFASRTADAAGALGTRTIQPVVVRGGAAHNGTEHAQPGLWVLASDAAGTSFSARLVRQSHLNAVQTAPLLPSPADASWDVLTGTFQLGQPAWSALYASGAELGRVSLTGTETRHVVYFELRNGQHALAWPSAPDGAAGIDPTTQPEVRFEVVAVDLTDGITPQNLFETRGVTLFNWAPAIDGYSRLDR